MDHLGIERLAVSAKNKGSEFQVASSIDKCGRTWWSSHSIFVTLQRQYPLTSRKNQELLPAQLTEWPGLDNLSEKVSDDEDY